MTVKFEFEKEKTKLINYIEEWDALILNDFEEPLTSTFPRDFFPDSYRGFIYRAHQYVTASLRALKTKNTHSLAALCRTNLELIVAHEIILLIPLGIDVEDHVADFVSMKNEIYQYILRNVKNDPIER